MALRTRWEREAEKRGKKLGEEAGKEAGIELGEESGRMAMADSLLKLLHDKFDDVPAWTKEKLSNANLATLKTWFDAVFLSKNVNAVFAQPE